MVIPSNAPNPKLAHEFINYILTYEASLSNTQEVGYASSNKQALEEMASENGDYFEHAAYLPRVGYDKDEVVQHNYYIKHTLYLCIFTKLLIKCDILLNFNVLVHNLSRQIFANVLL